MLINNLEQERFVCKKCGSHFINIKDIGYKKRVDCADCGAYIKFANKEEMDYLQIESDKNELKTVEGLVKKLRMVSEYEKESGNPIFGGLVDLSIEIIERYSTI